MQQQIQALQAAAVPIGGIDDGNDEHADDQDDDVTDEEGDATDEASSNGLVDLSCY